jgi:CO/xanthine dehydrogenase Mo-binding subunit
LSTVEQASESMIGIARPRDDARPKVIGATRYAADQPVAALLHARLVLATEAHALITRLHVEDAKTVPGVVAVLTADDLPIVTEGHSRSNEPLAREEIVFAGQPVALVVAETEAAAEDGVEAVYMETEPLEPVVDLDAAMAPGSVLARRPEQTEASDMGATHGAVGGGETALPEEELSQNVVGRGSFADGDVAGALAASDVVVEGRFETSWIYQSYIEPQAATAWVEPDGTLVVNSAVQGIFGLRDQLAGLFGLTIDKVLVTATPLGGAFGGKFGLVEPLVAGAALALKRPVRLTMTRTEDFAATNPAPAEIIELKVGARSDGTLTALEGRLIGDRGANPEWGIESISAILCGGVYRWPAFSILTYGVQTNRVTFGAYRGPGAPPASFALETLLDELAEKLGRDPIELRLQNVVDEGDRGLDGKPWVRIGARECLERIQEHPIWAKHGSLPADEGIGLAVGVWPGGNEPASAACRLDADGGLTVVTAAVDMSGVGTGFATIAAEAFGLPVDRIRIVAGDTATSPYTGASGGSKVTYTTGKAVQKAAAAAREALLAVAAGELEIAPADLEVVDGHVRAIGAPDRSIAVEKLAKTAIGWGGPYEPIEGHAGATQPSLAPSVAVHLAHVRVDRDTGAVRVLGYAIAQDVGRALNPALCAGQMRGGAVQGIGWALFEELAHDENGQPVSGSFVEYAIPRADDLPEIDALIVEVPAPDGPFGAKGIGEAPVIGAPGAIANALNACTGLRLRRLPMTAPRVWAALQER